jgi:ribonuclease-3
LDSGDIIPPPFSENLRDNRLKEPRFYFKLVHLLGFFPRKISLYQLAFLPKSASVGRGTDPTLNNERLEYLGDAILDAIVADYLFDRFPDANEGFMTKLRSRIVKRKNMDYLARQIEIPSLIRQDSLPGNKSKHLYGNTLEALIGAIYIDRGYRMSRRFFVRKIVQKHIDLVQLVNRDPDYKSRIIEWAQKNKVEVTFESREEHDSRQKSPSFVSTITLGGNLAGTGRGSAKKEAEQRAAKEAVLSVRNL